MAVEKLEVFRLAAAKCERRCCDYADVQTDTRICSKGALSRFSHLWSNFTSFRCSNWYNNVNGRSRHNLLSEVTIFLK